MADNGRPCLGRVNLTDLIPSEGLPSDLYKLSVSTLSQSLSQYSAAIVQFPPTDGALLRSSLDSARLYFHQKSFYTSTETVQGNGSREWCRTSGYYADPQTWLETYDYRPGLTPSGSDSVEFPSAALSEIFAVLGEAARYILEAISFYLNLRSSSFGEILDNVPLRDREVSSSVVSVCCHARPSFQEAQHHSFTAQEDGELGLFHDHEQHADKSLISILKTDKVGLHIHDIHGRWVLVDGDLGPQDTVVYPGLAMYQATAGYVSPALLRMDAGNLQDDVFGRCSLSFKLMPKSMASLNCSEMRAAGHGVEAQFQVPVQVDDFMQRSHPVDQLLNRVGFPSFTFSRDDGAGKPFAKRKKGRSQCKPLPPSKRLRLEAQRVLKEKVQEIADKKGIMKLRFCSLKECETHITAADSPCASTRLEIGWPDGVPFVHPHDLPNRAKIGFLEAYEPGWTASHDMDLTLIEPTLPGHSMEERDAR